MSYPILKARSIPGSGSEIYLYLMQHVHVPSRLPHELLYAGQKKKLRSAYDPFLGFFPVGETFELSYAGGDMGLYTFTGKEKSPVFVKDLSEKSLMQLGLRDADPKEKVWNPNFVNYENLPQATKISNETATISLAKSISTFLCNYKDILYTEQDVVEMLITAIKKCDSKQMQYILHSNHVAWCISKYIETGVIEEDMKRQFYGQNNVDFYAKDIGTIMPSMLYTLALLGVSPAEMIKELDYNLYGIDEIANKLETYMYSEKIRSESCLV